MWHPLLSHLTPPAKLSTSEFFSFLRDDEAEISVFGVPFDGTSTLRKTSRFAPSVMREVSKCLWEGNIFAEDINRYSISDFGDVEIDSDDPEEMIERVENFLREIPKKHLIAVGGEHLITYPVAMVTDSPVLSFDAHLDLCESYEGRKFSHATVMRRISETGREVVIVGYRTFHPDELKFARSSENVTAVTSREVKENPEEVISILQSFDDVYLSLDLDVFDPSYAPSVSTPEAFGISPWDFLKLTENLKIKHGDIVELSPGYDAGETAVLAVYLLTRLISLIL
ncbi:MAG: agmatinase [Archaeoglobi archaeon]|nr:agmatinase [Archaeoglobi archaeon]MDK2781260.1 agmatinase [Archaeoglobi archaeon]